MATTAGDGISLLPCENLSLISSRIFLIEGVITIFLAILAYLFVVPLPEQAAFLSAEEKTFLLSRLQLDDDESGECSLIPTCLKGVDT